MTSTFPDVRSIQSLTYTENSGGNPATLLFPFTYANGVLDLPASIPKFPGTSAPGNTTVLIRRLGGDNNVLSVGPNLQNYIKAVGWSDGTNTYTVTGNITVASQGVVTRVQQLSNKYLRINPTYKVYAGAWDNANFIGYNAVYVFDKPLVIQASATGGTSNTICITFESFIVN